MSRQTQSIICPVFLSSALFVVMCLLSCDSVYEHKCPVKDSIIWQHVLSRSFDDGGNISVAPMTLLGYHEYMYWGISGRGVAEELKIPDCNIDELVHHLYERNKSRTRLTLESNPELGYLVDTNSTYTQYFPLSAGGGWDKWYEDHPQSHGIATVSLPVYDPECQIVLVYRGIQEHWLSGEGWVFALRIEDSTLITVDSVMLWIS